LGALHRLVLHALAMRVHPTFFDLVTPLAVGHATTARWRQCRVRLHGQSSGGFNLKLVGTGPKPINNRSIHEAKIPAGLVVWAKARQRGPGAWEDPPGECQGKSLVIIIVIAIKCIGPLTEGKRTMAASRH